MIVFPNCKINIGLHVLNKREDGFHNIETIFYPVAFTDALEIIRNADAQATDVTFTLSGLELDASAENNICVKAYRLLKKDYPQLPAVKIHLHKTIPSGAGLGGGSADGAYTLKLLNDQFNLQLSGEQLRSYALQLGSDCPFFISNKTCYASGRGEVLQPVSLNLENYKIVIVCPGIHINTAWAFSQMKVGHKSPSLLQVINNPIESWKTTIKNDFEEVIFPGHPQLKEIKDQLYSAGAVYASMSGSGSSLYGIFKDLPSLKFSKDYLVKII